MVNVIHVTCMVMSELRGITTVCATGYELQLIFLTVGIIGVGIYSIECGRYIKYLVLVLEICMVPAIIVKGHVYHWKYHPYICLDLFKRG